MLAIVEEIVTEVAVAVGAMMEKREIVEVMAIHAAVVQVCHHN